MDSPQGGHKAGAETDEGGITIVVTLVWGWGIHHGMGAFAPIHENRATRLNLLTQIGDAVKDRRTQASLAADLPRIATLRVSPRHPDTKGRYAASRKITKMRLKVLLSHSGMDVRWIDTIHFRVALP